MQPADDMPTTPTPILGPDPRPPLITTTQIADLAVNGTHAVARLSGEIDVSNSTHLLEIGGLALADPRVDALVIDVSRV